MIKGLDNLEKRFEGYKHVDLEKPVAKGILHVQAAAKGLCLAVSGELRESIFASMEQDGRHTIGLCYTEKGYAPYVEFGTGPKGQKEHTGISLNIPVSYTQSPWWIHESQIDKEVAEKYHWFYITTEEGKFYQCTGQPARPFMYPALKDHEEEVLKIMQSEIRRQLK